jgi:signal transduction histidine kinase
MAARPGEPYGCAMSVREIVTRPFRLQAWKELAYLLLGLPVGVVTFTVVVTGVALGVSLLITLVGIPVLVATAYADRGLAWLERRRAALVVGRPISDPPYRRPERPGALAWLKALAVDPQTWKEAAWMVVVFAVGLVGFVVAVVLWTVALWAVTFPVYWWALPHDAVPQVGGEGDELALDTWPLAIAVGACGLVLLVVSPWVCSLLAQGQARLARVFLGPGAATARLGELTRSRAAAVDAQTVELRRIERDLHDGAQARLVAATIDLGLAQEKLEVDPVEARRLVEAAQAETKEAIGDLRRLVSGIAPAVLADRGLDAALSGLVASCRVPVSLEVRLPERLPEAVEVAAYFVAAESLTNVQKHAEATTASLQARVQDGRLVVEVTDDGRGDAAAVPGSGLDGLAARVTALDGRLLVTSPAGGPTVVRAEIPCVS